MCARYSLAATPEQLEQLFEVEVPQEYVPTYNIAPTLTAPVVKAGESGREMRLYRWGLIPSWANDASVGQRLINARADTAPEKSAFKAAFARRRCLVPATSFFEWREECPEEQSLFPMDPPAKAAKPVKQPYLFRLAEGDVFAMAGLWEFWRTPEGEAMPSYTVLTTEPNEMVADYHDRMPVILSPDRYDAWLDPELPMAQALAEILPPFPAEQMRSYPVSRLVGNPRNETPELIVPLS